MFIDRSRLSLVRFASKVAGTARVFLSSGSLQQQQQYRVLPHHRFAAITRTMASSAAAKRLEGKTIVITGASSGIGRSCVFEFARTAPNNLKLVLTARRVDRLHEIAAKIREEVGDGVKVLPFQLDVSDPDQVRGFVQRLPEEFRDIDILVNNAYVLTQSSLHE